MTHRPAIAGAKVDRLLRIITDMYSLKGQPQTERPDEASVADIEHACWASCEALAADMGTVTAVESVPLPSERLQNK
jgi:hypothetical protein